MRTLSRRIRSCSSGSVVGHGKTSSSWISPRKSDFANDETPSSASCLRGISSRTGIRRSLPTDLWRQAPGGAEPAHDRQERPEQPEDLLDPLALVFPEGERDPER